MPNEQAIVETPRLDGPEYLVNDIDSHEHIPVEMWPEAFGEGGVLGSTIRLDLVAKNSENSLMRPDITTDTANTVGITEKTVWELKGPDAPSTIDLSLRPQVMDAMGIDRQLIFPLFGLLGLMVRLDKQSANWFDDPDIDRRSLSDAMISGHNSWAARVQNDVGNRVRPVAVLAADSVSQMIQDAEALIADGLRAVLLPTGIPPGNTSPADRALEPLWSALAAVSAPVTFHIGSEMALFASQKWTANAAEFVAGDQSSHEFPIEPYRGSILHYAMEHYLSGMILGGVFERHPELRVVCLEGCAHWVGPLAERLDLWAEQFVKRLSGTLSMKPSEYIARNVRVAPYAFEFSAIPRYIERNPELIDVFCYSSDFPHFEGGRYSKREAWKYMQALGEEACQKFFYKNADVVLPAHA
jgi:predicted TIM-barrel fold metal-dependent hydrolase